MNTKGGLGRIHAVESIVHQNQPGRTGFQPVLNPPKATRQLATRNGGFT
jgi:hypothetical protein